MPTPEELRKNAENCAELAADATTEPNKKRLKRMEQAWVSLAETEEWLEGRPGTHADGAEMPRPQSLE
jgi:hypothetical protein